MLKSTPLFIKTMILQQMKCIILGDSNVPPMGSLFLYLTLLLWPSFRTKFTAFKNLFRNSEFSGPDFSNSILTKVMYLLSLMGFRNFRVFFGKFEILKKKSLLLAHAADITPWDKESASTGKICMNLTDWDRKLLCEENGYEVKLYSMNPFECTPKNNFS